MLTIALEVTQFTCLVEWIQTTTQNIRGFRGLKEYTSDFGGSWGALGWLRWKGLPVLGTLSWGLKLKVGIPEENQAHIFDPFFTTGRSIGDWIGLAIVHNLVTNDLDGRSN